MPFSPQETTGRLGAAAIRKADELANHIYEARLAKRERKTRAMLARRFPHIPANDAYELWVIATNLTDEIIWQYVNGERVLKAEREYQESLFYEWRLETSHGVSWCVASKDYLPVVERMARIYKDRGQVFSLRTRRSWGRTLPGMNSMIGVICTAPLPD